MLPRIAHCNVAASSVWQQLRRPIGIACHPAYFVYRCQQNVCQFRDTTNLPHLAVPLAVDSQNVVVVVVVLVVVVSIVVPFVSCH